VVEMRRTTSQRIEDRSHQRNLLLGRTVLPNARRRETLMFSLTIHRAVTATTFVLAFAASTSLIAARSDNHGSDQGRGRRNPAAPAPISPTVLPTYPGSGSNDPLIGSFGRIGSNGSSVVPGSNGGDNHAAAARSDNHGSDQGRGRK